MVFFASTPTSSSGKAACDLGTHSKSLLTNEFEAPAPLATLNPGVADLGGFWHFYVENG